MNHYRNLKTEGSNRRLFHMYKDKNPEFRKKHIPKHKISSLLLSAKNMPNLFSNRRIDQYRLGTTIGRGFFIFKYTLIYIRFLCPS